MALNIKDPETDRLARNLAKRTGESLTVAVKQAVKERLEREQRRCGKKIDREKLDRALARFNALPTVDPRPADELLDYDEWGLPR